MNNLKLPEEWLAENVSPCDVYIHKVSNVIVHKQTRFQEIYIVETPTLGKALVLDGKWQSATQDESYYHEFLVHPACVLHGSPRNALILGGGEGATAREILRWTSMVKVAMIDIDQEVVDLCRTYLPEMHSGSFDDPRLTINFCDAYEYAEVNESLWDLIVFDLSDPIESGPSFKLFTREFMDILKRRLAGHGVLAMQAGPIGPGSRDLQRHARLVNTLKSVFAHVSTYTICIPSYPAPWAFALASNAEALDLPSASEINVSLKLHTLGGMRVIDGEAVLGAFHLPLAIRNAIASEREVFTLSNPPKFFS